jgi:hypothetical protein
VVLKDRGGGREKEKKREDKDEEESVKIITKERAKKWVIHERLGELII